MEFKNYQEQAQKTAIYKDKLVYPALGLAGEAGEVSNKIKKILRDSNGSLSDQTRESILQELGDVLWYISALCTDLGADLDKVASDNLQKLFTRKKNNSISGEGDSR
jgi:NTP pyrophosphatase (non-canonical NTP hydrolase)